MDRRSFLKRFLVGIPVAVAAVPVLGSLVPEKVTDWTKGWRCHSFAYPALPSSSVYFDKDMIQSLKLEKTLLEALSSRHKFPVNAGVKREFFRYKVLGS